VDWPPTQLVDIGDPAVCARVMGHGPTIVSEAGGAGEGTTETFSGTVEEQLAEFATVVTDDRVGSGRSGGTPRETVAELAEAPPHSILGPSFAIGTGNSVYLGYR